MYVRKLITAGYILILTQERRFRFIWQSTQLYANMLDYWLRYWRDTKQHYLDARSALDMDSCYGSKKDDIRRSANTDVYS
jgi:hypothetical protein